MSELEVIKRLEAILSEYRLTQTVIPYYRIAQVIKDYHREEDEYLDNLYNSTT